MLLSKRTTEHINGRICFNGHPPLGVNATGSGGIGCDVMYDGFNGHPPLGVNATVVADMGERGALHEFQRAPTLGGECYMKQLITPRTVQRGFNGHPPLGVNATFFFWSCFRLVR